MPPLAPQDDLPGDGESDDDDMLESDTEAGHRYTRAVHHACQHQSGSTANANGRPMSSRISHGDDNNDMEYEFMAGLDDYNKVEEDGVVSRQTLFSDDPLLDDIADLAAETRHNQSSEKKIRETLDYVEPGMLGHPLSQYGGRPSEPCCERDVVKEFLGILTKKAGGEEIGQVTDRDIANAMDSGVPYIEFDLEDFSIYLPDSKHHPYEFKGLHHLQTGHQNNRHHFFDGVLVCDGVRRYVEKVPFKLCTVAGYGKDDDGVNGQIWVQSHFSEGRSRCVKWRRKQARTLDIHYRLKNPSAVYKRFHDSFLWIADLAKHVADYMVDVMEERQVSIHDFRSRFADWLDMRHGESNVVRKWWQQYANDRDFRRAISANGSYLLKEALGIDERLEKQSLWREVVWTSFIPEQKMRKEKTIVTPFVYECFKHLRSGCWLESVSPVESVELPREESNGDVMVDDTGEVRIGDVVAIEKEDERGSAWKDHNEYWYLYVQAIHVDKYGLREFDGIWLYAPSQTTCGDMKYPYDNELFFSDHCTCKESRYKEAEVLFKATVEWNGLPDTSHGASGTMKRFFIRQRYTTEFHSFETLQKSHMRCEHLINLAKTPLQAAKDEYGVGDTILVKPPARFRSTFELEPAEITGFAETGSKGAIQVQVRRLHRRQVVDKLKTGTFIAPNELVYGTKDQDYHVDSRNVARKCLVRFYDAAQVLQRQIPTPYDRAGTGDAFFITSRMVRESDGSTDFRLEEMRPEDRPTTLRQGFDPLERVPRNRLRGMDLYCGGGTFGRGIEEGGAVKNKWAIDLDTNAMHTYHANLREEDDTKLFLGSVNDFLYQAILDNPMASPLIPRPGQVDFISAGSPCTGFSLLNSRRDDSQGLMNQSLVASVAAYIDFYRPKYALLENVASMSPKGEGAEENMLAQLICCLVAMGYQLQLFVLDSWSVGSAQSRTRLFVSAAAPGLALPQPPALSHSHPENMKERGLGRMANGETFGKRRFVATPFNFVSCSEATADLPDIGDGKIFSCIPFPDHRMTAEPNTLKQNRMNLIPMQPRGMNQYKVIRAGVFSSGHGLLSDGDMETFPSAVTLKGSTRQSRLRGSRAFERLDPDGIYPTVSTACQPECSRGGKVLHWSQPRLMTVMEARRAQSYPDHEVLIGAPVKQWRIVGNSVARTVALALGLSLREAWLKNCPDTPEADEVPLTEVPLSSIDQIGQSLFRTHSIKEPHPFKPKSASPASSSYSALQNTRGMQRLGLESSVSSDGGPARGVVCSSRSSGPSSENGEIVIVLPRVGRGVLKEREMETEIDELAGDDKVDRSTRKRASSTITGTAHGPASRRKKFRVDMEVLAELPMAGRIMKAFVENGDGKVDGVSVRTRVCGVDKHSSSSNGGAAVRAKVVVDLTIDDD